MRSLRSIPRRAEISSAPAEEKPKARVILKGIICGVLALTFTVGWGQEPVAIPGNPKGDLKTELLQSLAAVRSMEATLERIHQTFPQLKAQTAIALSSWQYSPFARGARYIEEDIQKDAGQRGTDLLAEIDKLSKKTIDEYGPVDTLQEAQAFLHLVEKRAKGEIELPMVRGMLLWNCPEYQETPEKEIQDGYVTKKESMNEGVKISAEWPMSWKDATPRNPKILQKFQSHWGHGKLSGMLRVDTLPALDNFDPAPNQVYDEMTREDVEADFPEMKILSFQKTRVNGQPIILMSAESDVEQLMVRMKMVTMSALAYHRDQCAQINLMIPLLPAADPVAELKKREALFLSIINSFRVTFPADELAEIGRSKPSKVEKFPSSALPKTSEDDFEMYVSEEFRFAAKLPKEVVTTEGATPFGKIGNFKALDENRGSIYSITVNRIDKFVREEQRGFTEWDLSLIHI